MAVMYWLTGSRFGLFMRAMREDQEAAAAMGVNVVRYKIMIFVVTSMIVGMAGAVFYHQVGIITPNTMELLQMSLVIAMAVIGGIESLLGQPWEPCSAASPWNCCAKSTSWVCTSNLGAWRYAAFGLLLMFTLRFAQNGLISPDHRSDCSP